MHAWDVRGYGFDGALYCPDHVPQAAETGCTCGESDANGACESNCHGYGPNPVFGSDECDGTCDTCGETI